MLVNLDMQQYTKPTLLILICAFVILVQYYVITGGNYKRPEVASGKLVVMYNNSKTLKNADLPPLYIITPTYRKPEQIPELVRLSQALQLVSNLTWLVIEDGVKKNPYVEQVIRKSGLTYRYLLAPMPKEYKNATTKPKGVSNRNRGLEWVRRYAKTGVFYFADDDNTYEVELFHEIRKTKTVSMFPVGLVTKVGLSSPIVKNCTIIGFYDGWIGGRKFPVDMAGFAVSVEFLAKRPNATMPYEPGYEEDGFLRSLAPFEPEDAQLLASCCTKILVWHTQTVGNNPAEPADLTNKFNNTNIDMLNKFIV